MADPDAETQRLLPEGVVQASRLAAALDEIERRAVPAKRMALAVVGAYLDRGRRMKRTGFDSPVRQEGAEIIGGGPVLDGVAAQPGRGCVRASSLEDFHADAATRKLDRGRQPGEAAADNAHPRRLHGKIGLF